SAVDGGHPFHQVDVVVVADPLVTAVAHGIGSVVAGNQRVGEDEPPPADGRPVVRGGLRARSPTAGSVRAALVGVDLMSPGGGGPDLDIRTTRRHALVSIACVRARNVADACDTATLTVLIERGSRLQ